MPTFNEMAGEFLAQQRIAVVGMSRKEGGGTANGIYRTLRDEGYEVFAINPHATELEGDPCYPSVSAVPGGVDGVMIVTSPDVTDKVVLDCARAGVPRIWMHDNTLLPGSVSDDAVAFCREKGIQVIAGGCPMMFIDPFHKCLKFVLGAVGRLPQAEA
jgi:hypothetical protein